MFTGIIEAVGEIKEIKEEGLNKSFKINSPISAELKIDQSVSHDGVCLTVTEIQDHCHWVTAVSETLNRTQLSQWKIGGRINLERAMVLGQRLDGHMVQGHVDAVGKIEAIDSKEGSWEIMISFPPEYAKLLVDKGSVCVNGISLTVITPTLTTFKVAIIPYTWEHTQLSAVMLGDYVNLEFDILGKYLQRFSAVMQQSV